VNVPLTVMLSMLMERPPLMLVLDTLVICTVPEPIILATD
jgi:hypothetical protein